MVVHEMSSSGPPIPIQINILCLAHQKSLGTTTLNWANIVQESYFPLKTSKSVFFYTPFIFLLLIFCQDGKKSFEILVLNPIKQI